LRPGPGRRFANTAVAGSSRTHSLHAKGG
jgi:hypothetical protein